MGVLVDRDLIVHSKYVLLYRTKSIARAGVSTPRRVYPTRAECRSESDGLEGRLRAIGNSLGHL
jgi:hypothetical protein